MPLHHISINENVGKDGSVFIPAKENRGIQISDNDIKIEYDEVALKGTYS